MNSPRQHRLALDLSGPYCDTRLWRAEKWYLSPPPNAAMRFPDEVRKCVAYFGREHRAADGTIRQKFKGTGFFVAVPSEDHPGVHHGYLVTAQHVVSELRQSAYFVRLNVKNGTSIKFYGHELRPWRLHPKDPAHEDVAVCEFALPREVESKCLPIEMLHPGRPLHHKPDIESEEVGIGDEIAITGLFTGHHGTERNIPIVRMGNVAMMPEEKVKTEHFGDIDAYLVEARSVGGLSGSPVFVETSSWEGTPLQKERLRLLGLIHGHWDIRASMRADVEDASRTDNISTGIAIVVPAQKILQILLSDEFVKRRAEQAVKIRAENMTTED